MDKKWVMFIKCHVTLKEYSYYTLIPYRYYEDYEEAFSDYRTTSNMNASDIVALTAGILKSHDNASKIDNNVNVLYDNLSIDSIYIDKYEPSPKDIVYLASIDHDEDTTKDIISHLEYDVVRPTLYKKENYSHIMNQTNDVFKSIYKINSKLMDKASKLLIPTLEETKDMMNRFVFIEVHYMRRYHKPIYMLYDFVPTTYWGYAIKELDGITILNGDYSLMRE